MLVLDNQMLIATEEGGLHSLSLLHPTLGGGVGGTAPSLSRRALFLGVTCSIPDVTADPTLPQRPAPTGVIVRCPEQYVVVRDAWESAARLPTPPLSAGAGGRQLLAIWKLWVWWRSQQGRRSSYQSCS